MTKNRAFWISLVIVAASARLALADNVVVTPSTTQPVQPVQPVQAAPVQPVPQPVYTEPSHRSEVHADVTPPRNYVGTIAVSALMGGVAGALIGGAIYFLDNQTHPYNVVYWASGGVLVGTAVGVTQVVVQENRASEATALNRLPQDPAPTMRLALYKAHF
jgi:predicted membrane protein